MQVTHSFSNRPTAQLHECGESHAAVETIGTFCDKFPCMKVTQKFELAYHLGHYQCHHSNFWPTFYAPSAVLAALQYAIRLSLISEIPTHRMCAVNPSSPLLACNVRLASAQADCCVRNQAALAQV